MHGAQNCGAGGKRPEDLPGFFLHLDGFTFGETQSHTICRQLLTNMVVDLTRNGGQLSLGVITWLHNNQEIGRKFMIILSQFLPLN